MPLESVLGKVLVSQDMEEWIKRGKIRSSSFDSSQIQPSSFDAALGDEGFIIDTDVGLLRPPKNKTVYRAILELPRQQRQRVSLQDGFEIKRGFTYLMPLDVRVTLAENEFIRSSPKSSPGRVFLQSRLLSDYNNAFDQVTAPPDSRELQLWLLVQPRPFNLLLWPGIALNQLRFYTGPVAPLNPAELTEECARNPLLHYRNERGQLVPAPHRITDGLQLHLDLEGKATDGVIGLRARHTPSPIDMRLKGAYEPNDFFEPILRHKNGITVRNGEHYLFASKEVLQIPPHLNVIMEDHSYLGIRGPLHFAGFVDNGFRGDLVLEVSPEESTSVVMEDGMPISALQVRRTDVPEKKYGPKIGSNYQEQVGPRPAKYFKPFDYVYAARNYKKLSRTVLVHDAKILGGFRKHEEGFEQITPECAARLLHEIQHNGFFHSRYDCETDEAVLQCIPYVLIFGQNQQIFSYVRARNIEDYGDERLFGKHSIGVGGHVIPTDEPLYIERCINRELEEEVFVTGQLSKPLLVGTLMQYNMPVDRVHFGLVYATRTTGTVGPKESSIISGHIKSIDELLHDPKGEKKYETWSRVLLPHLREIHNAL